MSRVAGANKFFVSWVVSRAGRTFAAFAVGLIVVCSAPPVASAAYCTPGSQQTIRGVLGTRVHQSEHDDFFAHSTTPCTVDFIESKRAAIPRNCKKGAAFTASGLVEEQGWTGPSLITNTLACK